MKSQRTRVILFWSIFVTVLALGVGWTYSIFGLLCKEFFDFELDILQGVGGEPPGHRVPPGLMEALCIALAQRTAAVLAVTVAMLVIWYRKIRVGTRNKRPGRT